MSEPIDYDSPRRPALEVDGDSPEQLTARGAPAQPRAGADLRRRPARTRVHLGRAPAATGPRLHFPSIAVGTDVYVATAAHARIPVPPVALDFHLPTV